MISEKSEESKRFFNGNVKEQLIYLKHPLHKYQKLKRYIHAIGMANITKNDVVLEIGCGIGYQIPYLLKKCKSYYGIDFSKESIAICRIYCKSKKAILKVADAHKLPFNRNVFDVALIIDTLENFENPERVLDEASRVLKENGRIVVSVPNIKSFYGLLTFMMQKRLDSLIPPIQKWFDVKKMVFLLEKKGFDIVDIRGSFFIPPFYTGRNYLIPYYKTIPRYYDHFENVLSKHMKMFGHHIIICAKKR